MLYFSDVDVREAIEEVVIPSNRRLWKPDTYFMNADEKEDDLVRNRVVVEPSGYVRSSEKYGILFLILGSAMFFFLTTRPEFTLFDIFISFNPRRGNGGS